MSDAKLFVLSRETFSRILGNIRDYLKEDYKRSNSMEKSFESENSETLLAVDPTLKRII